MPRKRSDEDNEDMMEDDDQPAGTVKDDEDEDDSDDEDTLDLDEAEAEEEDDDDVDEEDEEAAGESVEVLEARRLFQGEAEETLEHLTLDEVKDVLKERGLDAQWAVRLKKLLKGVIADGEVSSWEEAWEEALDELEDDL